MLQGGKWLSESRWKQLQKNVATTIFLLALTANAVGQQAGGNKALVDVIAAYRETLKARTRERAPLEWAAAQNDLGNALAKLGEREGGSARLEEAVAAYREALKERTASARRWNGRRHRTILAMRSSGSGSARADRARLEEAVAAYREALKERTRERAPLEWAATQNSLGIALAQLAERESGSAQSRGSGRGLSRGVEGTNARARAARMGGDAKQSWQCARAIRRNARTSRDV